MIFARLLKAEFKAMAFKLPKIILSGAVIIVLAALLFLAISLQKTDSGKSIIAVSAPNDTFTNVAITAVENMESVSKLCKLVRVNENEAEAMVYDNRASAALIFGENFVEDIISGKNTQPRIIVNEKGNELFMELANCGSSMLASVQAGIYSAERVYYEQTGQKITSQQNKELNMEYINTVFSRERAFNKLSNNSFTLSEYYIAMLIPVFLLLFAMSLSEIAFPEKLSFYKYSGLRYGFITLIQLIKIFVLEFIAFSIIFFVVRLMGFRLYFDVISIINASAITTMFYSIVKNKVNGSLAILFFTVIMGFASGCFLPPAFLSDSIRDITEYMPLNAMGSGFMGNINIYYDIAIFVAAAIISILGGVKK